MKVTDSILTLYFILCFTIVISFHYGCDSLARTIKMILIPIIFLYYYKKAKKINWLMTFILLFCFLGNIFNIFNVLNQNLYIIMTLFLIAYILFLILGIQDMSKFKLYKIETISIAFVIGFVFYLYYSVICLLTENYQNFFLPFSVYGFVLALAAIISPINIILKNRSYDLYYFFVVICFMISDVFYVINYYYFKMVVIQILDHSLEVMSYFFLVKYILSRENFVEEKYI